jgi:FAD/FMN-containing dehydrogenase
MTPVRPIPPQVALNSSGVDCLVQVIISPLASISDVHGKNHHVDGCFSECVQEFEIMLANGDIITCTKQSTPELFKATCGGMGLTGVILNAKIYLKKINSKYIDQTTIKTKNLKETFAAFEEYKSTPYSVAWIDCLAKGSQIGKCLLMIGDFRNDGKLDYKKKPQLSIPFNFPSFALNNYTVRAFNWLYYHLWIDIFFHYTLKQFCPIY